MEEQKLLKEGNFAITTDRIIWGEKGVYDFGKIDLAYVSKSDWWKGTASAVVVGAILLAIGATWSIVVGLLFLGLGYFFWHSKVDSLVLISGNDQRVELPIPNTYAGFAAKINDALSERRRLVNEHNEGHRTKTAQSALDEIDNLPGG